MNRARIVRNLKKLINTAITLPLFIISAIAPQKGLTMQPTESEKGPNFHLFNPLTNEEPRQEAPIILESLKESVRDIIYESYHNNQWLIKTQTHLNLPAELKNEKLREQIRRYTQESLFLSTDMEEKIIRSLIEKEIQKAKVRSESLKKIDSSIREATSLETTISHDYKVNIHFDIYQNQTVIDVDQRLFDDSKLIFDMGNSSQVHLLIMKNFDNRNFLNLILNPFHDSLSVNLNNNFSDTVQVAYGIHNLQGIISLTGGLRMAF